MPAVSQAQFRWLHTDDAEKKLGKSGVSEWIGATGSPKDLPEKKKERSTTDTYKSLATLKKRN